jgi:hypothetical protein
VPFFLFPSLAGKLTSASVCVCLYVVKREREEGFSRVSINTSRNMTRNWLHVVPVDGCERREHDM